MLDRKGFTLIELLVVVAIIALLVAILVPVVTQAVEQGKIAVCGSNLHQIMLAMRMYYDDSVSNPDDVQIKDHQTAEPYCLDDIPLIWIYALEAQAGVVARQGYEKFFNTIDV